jgi:hypothetical protein
MADLKLALIKLLKKEANLKMGIKPLQSPVKGFATKTSTPMKTPKSFTQLKPTLPNPGLR